jgi:DNA polymerase-3 subunit epsilon
VSLIQARYGADIAAWLPGNALSFDTETTGIDPTEARIVTASCIEVGADGSVDRGSWLVDPGIEIPERATAIHGVSTAKARAEGQPPHHVLPIIITVLADAWRRGLPVIVMNAGYDLTLVQAEARRLGLPELSLGPVLDPLAIDRLCRPDFRGGRKLVDLALHYRVKQEDAHNSRGDALTAARVVWKQARLYPEFFSLTLADMQQAQADAHRAWAEGLGDYLRRNGKPDNVEREWPLRRLKGAT